MKESRSESRLSTKGGGRGRHRYLVRRGQSWRFQVRVPVELDPLRKMPALRVNLGAQPIRSAARMARMLAAAAEFVFAQLRSAKMTDNLFDPLHCSVPFPDRDDDSEGALAFHAYMADFFRRMTAVLDWNQSHPQPEMVDPQSTLDRQLFREHMAIYLETQKPEASSFLRAKADQLRRDANAEWARKSGEFHARGLAEAAKILNEAAPPIAAATSDRLLTALENQNTLLAEMLRRPSTASAVPADPSATPAPAVSSATPAPAVSSATPAPAVPSATLDQDRRQTLLEATEAYIVARVKANGGVQTADIGSIRGRAKFFATVVGDKPFTEYGRREFQELVNKLQFWPPEPETHPELRGKSIEEILEENERGDHCFGVMARKTVLDHYLTEMRTILRDAARNADLPEPALGFRLQIPKIFKSSEKRRPPKIANMTEVFRKGVDSGKLDKAVLPWLGMTSGRRIGLLVYLRGNHFKKVGNNVIAQVPEQIADPDTGRVTRVPMKNEDSRAGFVMHRSLIESGFCDFAISLGDQYLFASRHACKDPADAAQKMANGLLARVDVARKKAEAVARGEAIRDENGKEKEFKAEGTFHGLRHWLTTQLRAAGVSEYAQRVQVGHTRGDEHEEYGELPFSFDDAERILNLEMPPEVDFSMFMGLKFATLRR